MDRKAPRVADSGNSRVATAGRTQVHIECRSARRYVHSHRGFVNKRPGRSHGLTQFERALMKVNPVALCATGTDVPRVWIEQHSRRKLRGTRQQQPGLLARALPLQGRCHRFESGWAHHTFHHQAPRDEPFLPSCSSLTYMTNPETTTEDIKDELELANEGGCGCSGCGCS